MKKKIIIGLSVFALIFFLGALYMVITIEKSTSKLDNLIRLHQIEILREQLLLSMKKVQSDLHLKNTRHSRSIPTIVSHVQKMENLSNTCFECHHSQDVLKRLSILKSKIEVYKESLSRVLTIRANISRLEQEEDSAFMHGEDLIKYVNSMIAITNIKLTQKTELAINEIARTKTILYFLLIAAPLLMIGLGFIFIRGVTRPVIVLQEAAQRLKGGNLDYRIEGLKDEFEVVGSAFNEMAEALQESIRKIKDSEIRYRTLFESAGDAIFIIEAEGEKAGNIVDANHAAAVMHGYTMNEIKKLNIRDIDSPEEGKNVQDRIKYILAGNWINIEMEHRRKDGTTFPVEVSAGLLQLLNHNYIIGFDRDITQRKTTELAFQKAERMTLLAEMAAGLVHEIKNPLAGVKVSLHLLADDKRISEEDRDLLQKSREEIKRIESLLKNLLNYTRPPKPKFAIVDINDILDKTLNFSLNHPSAKLHNINSMDIRRDYDKDIPETKADPFQLQQIFMNLIYNAIEAMQEGGTLSVSTSLNIARNYIIIIISDTGSGIDQSVKERIFQPFFTTKSKGTGLGLAVSKSLIEQHSGILTVENNSDKGTIFKIDLPVSK